MIDDVSPDLFGESTAGVGIASGVALPSLPAGNRYVLLEPLGTGGQAVVYTAYDRKLDRKIAIKVLREELGPAPQATLLREAQALARLRHPNVVTVHDTGTFGGQLFIAMELVEGASLRVWLQAGERGWREVLRVFLDAGRGLAAAHARGLVHRDFKPDNVLIGDRGEVRVADFGLARAVDRPDEKAGLVVGTPRYMAPEQLAGAPVNPRADQYAFCVALRAALEARPGVPRRFGAILRRGLSKDPAARYPSMDALLGDLARAPFLLRRPVLAAIGIAGVAATAALALARRPPAAEDPCAGAAARLAGAWDGPARARMRAAFLATGRGYAEDTFARVGQRLDAYAGDWVAMRTEACRAHQRHEQSDALFNLRVECLDRRRGALAGLVAVLGQEPDAKSLDGAVAAVAALADLARCADREALTAAMPPPAPELKPRVEALRARLDTAEALYQLAKFPQALPIATAAVDEAGAVPYPPIQAAARATRFRVLAAVRDFAAAPASGAEALLAAARARDDVTAANVWLSLIFLVSEGERPGDARALFPGAEAAIARAGDDPGLRARLLYVEGLTHRKAGDYAAAQRCHEEALRILDQAARPDDRGRAQNLKVLGEALVLQARFAEAREASERAIALMVRALGPEAAPLASYILHDGNIFERWGRLDEARSRYERALALVERAEPEGSTVWTLEANLALVAQAQELHDEAIRHHRRALELARRTLAPDHPFIAGNERDLAAALARAGRPAEAVEAAERTLVRARKAGRDDELAPALGTLAVVRLEQGALASALATCDEGLAVAERLPPYDGEILAGLLSIRAEVQAARGRIDLAAPDDARALEIRHRLAAGSAYEAGSLTALGERYVALGRAAEAAPLLERAIVLHEETGGGAIARARARFGLARARPDRAAALRLAADAEERYAALGPRNEKERLSVARWRRMMERREDER